MTVRKPRIAVAGFHHETNTFAPAKTPYEEFVKDDGWPGLVEGEAVIDALLPLNLGMGGFIESAQAAGWDLAPILWCNAEPFAHVTEDAYERIAGKIVDAVRQMMSDAPVDGIYLCMHGAMVAEHSDDGEGELLQRLRKVVGADLPIVLSLDLHANITPRMFELADAMSIFRTYPHVDMADTGKRAFGLLERMLVSERKLAKAYAQIPFLLPLPSQYTGDSPCREIYQKVESLEHQDLLSRDFACGFPPADIPHCGASVVCYANTQSVADQSLSELFDHVVAAEPLFAAEMFSADDAVVRALELVSAAEAGTAVKKDTAIKPVVIADIQDNPGAGGSGDTTGLLEALVRNGAHNAVLACIWDPLSAGKAVDAGVDSVVSLALGGLNGPPGVEPFKGNFRVLKVTDGKFVCRGPMMLGTQVKIGPTVLVALESDECDVQVVVSSERSQCLDQGFLRLVDIEPLDKAIICVKSTVHFRNDFESVASEILLASAPGANPCNLHDIPYTKLRDSVRFPNPEVA